MLPRRPSGFVGREHELERLSADLGLHSLLLIEGPRGIGKTALALELAHRAPQALWLRVHEGEQAESLLHRLAPELTPHFDADALAAVGPLEDKLLLLVQALDARRTCLFLDEAERLHDLASFLRPFLEYLSATSLVVTSCERVPLTSAERADAGVVRLGPLGREEARQLAETWLGPGDWGELLELAAGQPLALKLGASLLREGRALSARGLVDQAWVGLGPDELDTLRLLAVASTPLPAAGLPGLEELERRFLVEHHGSHVALHELLAASLRVGLAEAPAYHRRVAALWGSDPRALPHLLDGGQLEEARELLRQEKTRLYQSGRFQELLAALEWVRDPDLDVTRADVLASLGRLEEAIALLRQVENGAGPSLRLKALNSRCHLLLDLGRLEEAQAAAKEAMDLAGGLPGRQPGLVKALNGQARAMVVRAQGQLGQALAERSLELAQEMHDPKGTAYAGFIRAQALYQQERWQECLEQAEVSVEQARQVGELRLVFLGRFLVGATLLRMGRLQEAAAGLERAWQDSRRFPDLKMTTMAELMQAQQLLAQERSEQARIHLLAAEEKSRRLGNPVLAVQILLLKSQLEPTALVEAREMARRIGALHLEAECSLRQDSLAPRPFRVLTHDGESRLTQSEYANLCQRAGDFELWIDLAGRKAVERNLGELPLLGKKLLTRLLVTLLEARGQALSAEELFARAWDHPWEGEASAAQVRKNISALRDLVEPERSCPRYVTVREHAYGVKGGYCVDQGSRWCLVESAP